MCHLAIKKIDLFIWGGAGYERRGRENLKHTS